MDFERADQPSLRRYLETLKERWLFILLCVVVCTGAAAAYAFTADEVYEAHADMLVTPVPDDQTAVLGLGLIRRASDPTRDVTTAARLISNPQVATLVARDLRSSESPGTLLGRIDVQPVAQSSIVSITAEGGTPREAALLANAFARAAVTERTDQLHRELDPAIDTLRKRIDDLGASATSTENQPLFEQLATLETLRSGPDPTLRLETPATEPAGPVAPRKTLSLMGGFLAGLLLGIAGAFVLRALDTKREREDRLHEMGLTVLARVPDLRRSRSARHAFEEAFRFLRTALRFASSDHPYSTVAVTSAAEREGKTTTSSQLAFAALEAGQTVILVEVDAYRPALRRVMEPATDHDLDGPGLLDYLSDRATLDEIVKPTATPGLSFVPAGSLSTGSITGLIEQQQGAFIQEFAELADLVILDCPPVGPRSDAILIAAIADAVIVVVDAKHSRESEVANAARLLRAARAEVVGVVLNRDDSPLAEYSYQESSRNGMRKAPLPAPANTWRAKERR